MEVSDADLVAAGQVFDVMGWQRRVGTERRISTLFSTGDKTVSNAV